MAQADTLVEPPVAWDLRGQRYREEGISVLEPFEGYWVNNLTNSVLTLRIPPVEEMVVDPTSALGPFTACDKDEKDAGDSWSIRIAATCLGACDLYNFAGVKPDGKATWDRHDRTEPPMSPGKSISLYFPHPDWSRRPGNYARDIRCEQGSISGNTPGMTTISGEISGLSWSFEISKNFTDDPAGDEITLQFDEIDDIPVDAEVLLIDLSLSKAIDLKVENTYVYRLARRDPVTKAGDTRFVLLVGSSEFVESEKEELTVPPTSTFLHQNYPNPFNPSTVIRYEIAKASEVAISIYDVKGSLVTVLYRGRRGPGRYEEVWESRNSLGVEVTSGVYFYRLVAGGYIRTRKMVLLR
jgi:hypothetical protein